VGTAYERGASAPLSFGHWNEFFSSSLLNIELSLRELAASAAEKLQLVYDTERKDLYVQDGADKLSVQCAARKGSTEREPGSHPLAVLPPLHPIDRATSAVPTKAKLS
jgi:hypothetical protein